MFNLKIWGWVTNIFGFMPMDTRSTVFKYRICISLEWDGHPNLGNNSCFNLLPAELHHSLAEGSPSTAGPKSNVSCLVTNLEQDIQAFSFPWLCTRQSFTSGWTTFSIILGWCSRTALRGDWLLRKLQVHIFPFFYLFLHLYSWNKKLSFPSDGYGLAVTAQIHLICQETRFYSCGPHQNFSHSKSH